jgi:hypothetical protein
MEINWDILLSGFGGVVIGTIVSYVGQSRLVTRQIRAAEKAQREMVAATERSNKEFVALLQEARNMLNTRFAQISGSLATLEKKIDVA